MKLGRAAGLPPSALVDCVHTMSLQDSMALQAATDLTYNMTGHSTWMSVIEHNKAGQTAVSTSRMQSCYVTLPAVDKSNSMLSGCFTFNNSIETTAMQVRKDHANTESGKDHCINFKCAWQPYMLEHNAVLLCSPTCTCILVTAQGHRCTYIWVWVSVLSKPWFSFTQ